MMSIARRTSTLRSLAAVACLGLPLAHAAPAAASEPPPAPAAPTTAADDALSETARELFTKGAKAWEQDKWDQCRAALLAAWGIKKHAQIAANLGACELKLGLYRDAAEHLAYFLREATPEKLKEAGAAMKALLAEATAKIVTVTIKTDPPDAEVLLEGKSLGRGPFPEPMYLEPRTYVIEMRAEGRKPDTARIPGIAGMRKDLFVRLKPAEPAASPPPGPSGGVVEPEPVMSGPTKVPAAVLGGVVVVGTVVALTLFGGAGSDRSAAEGMAAAIRKEKKSCVRGAANFDARCSEVESLASSSDTQHDVGVGVLIGVGAAAAGMAAFIVVPALMRAEEQAPQATPSTGLKVRAIPAASADGGGVFVVGRF
jgi:hypothetical protein